MTNAKLRRGRHSETGAYYAITTVTRDRRAWFNDPALAAAMVREIEAADGEWVDSHAWVLMPDHLHWLFELRGNSLSRFVQRFKSRSARMANTVRGIRGSLWQAGFYDHRLRGDEDLLSQARYIVCNPLRKGLVAKVDDYPYWRCRWIAGHTDL